MPPDKKIKLNILSDSEGYEGQGVHTAFVEMVESLKLRGDVDVLVNSNERCDLVHAHTLGPHYFKRFLKYKGRRVITAHVVTESFKGSLILYEWWKPIAKWFLKWAYGSAERVVCVSPYVQRELKAMGVKSGLVLIPNCVNEKRFYIDSELRKKGRELLKLSAGEVAVVSVGQIQPRKGVIDFIETARRLPQYRFIWLGGRPFGRLTADFDAMNQAMKHAPSNVSFAGSFSLEQMPALYNACDVFFAASHQETFGLVNVEAAACGLPLVMRDNAEYPELFGGAYLAAKDLGAFSAAIQTAALAGPERNKLIVAGRGLVERYSSKVYAQKLVDCYRELLSSIERP